MKPWQMGDSGYVRGNVFDFDAAIHDMQAHPCAGIECVDNPKSLTLGWECPCGMKWMFQLSVVKHAGAGSRYREEFKTRTGRERMIWQRNGHPILRGEEVVSTGHMCGV